MHSSGFFEIIRYKDFISRSIYCLHSDIVYSGMLKTATGYQLNNGDLLHTDSTYRVLTNDYLYSRPDLNYQKYDPDPYDTSINYRQPLIDWLRSMKTTHKNPINAYLDGDARR